MLTTEQRLHRLETLQELISNLQRLAPEPINPVVDIRNNWLEFGASQYMYDPGTGRWVKMQ